MTRGHGRACHVGGCRRRRGGGGSGGLASGAALALSLSLVVAERVEIAVAAKERELAVARRAAGGATDPLGGSGGRRRSEPSPPLGAAMTRAALDGHPEELPADPCSARVEVAEAGRAVAGVRRRRPEHGGSRQCCRPGWGVDHFSRAGVGQISRALKLVPGTHGFTRVLWHLNSYAGVVRERGGGPCGRRIQRASDGREITRSALIDKEDCRSRRRRRRRGR